jgi:hypothetical protein
MAASALLPAGSLLAAGPWVLAAGVDDFLWVIILVISFVVWIYNQIKKANEEAAKKPQGAPPNLDAEPASPRTTQTGTPARQPPARGQQPQRKPARPALADRPALSMAQSDEDDPWAKREAVASHVQRHLDTREFEQRTGSFGQLSRLDSQVDEHVEQAFAHEVSTIADEGASTEAEQQAAALAAAGLATSSAAGIAELFSDPDRLRNAIVLQEVLRPPSWD